MSYVEKTCYDVKCDACGEVMDTDNGDFHEHYGSHDEANEHAIMNGWHTKDGRHVCMTCPWPEDEDDEKEASEVQP